MRVENLKYLLDLHYAGLSYSSLTLHFHMELLRKLNNTTEWSTSLWLEA